jgi:hypothetical protein
MTTPAERIAAVAKALWFGLLPWWLYERECHYAPKLGYLSHAWTNILFAWRFATGAEDYIDRAYERADRAEKIRACGDWYPDWLEEKRREEEHEERQRRLRELQREIQEESEEEEERGAEQRVKRGGPQKAAA